VSAELTAREEALVLPIVVEIAKEPGVQVRELCAVLGKNLSTTLRVLQRLVDTGVIERRRISSQYREVSGLWLR
jgi:DNA-binding IclR family transcriptional regulator